MPATQTAASTKIRFVVLDENIFGYVLPQLPHSLQILMSKASKGATRFWQDGPYPLPLDGARVRPATRADFHDYRIHVGAYATDPACEFPAN